MKYIALIYADEAVGPQPGTPEFDTMMEGYAAATAKFQEDGVMVSGEPLDDVANATTVAVRGGKTEVVDGPFAETKEQLGGFYVLDCPDLDSAIKYAAMIPSATYGRVELRPVPDMGSE